ncbi:UPAR/Ly6 domain-containing protein qvr isoform X1 [Lepeophtheirus salmonis]|uniref:UPAR/Ly6 domain-containing protein qvr n=1 Tax=Lepeophtheirus salmonis TaxID=72036 RepID=D3PFK7_LEPSM|nr:protein quiver-like isoform X1 [Lepeophtheirus salmonis]ADD24053.1 Protein quiver [Lepeophtheirus salmonis]
MPKEVVPFSGLSPLVPVLSLLLFGILFTKVESVAECMSGNSVKCFECNSREDFRCNDPFNWTTLPLVEDCTGCCVKMVQDIGTEKEFVRRTCTNYIEINLFIVDHVCMKEKRGKGKACYCETNECNGTIKYLRPNEGLLPLSLLFLTLVSAISSNLISSFSSYPPTIAAVASLEVT